MILTMSWTVYFHRNFTLSSSGVSPLGVKQLDEQLSADDGVQHVWKTID